MFNPSLHRRALACALGLAALFSSGWAAAKACPPPTQAPSQEQIVAAAREAKDRGFLWTVERDGKTSYLYGTLHVGKLAWAMPGPRVAQALRSSKVLALELDVSDPKIQQQLVAQIQAPGPSQLSPELQVRMREAAEALCISWDALAMQRPEFQLATLTVATARYDELDVSFGSEVVLAGAAPALGLPVRSLETVDEQINALSMETPAELAEMVDAGLRDLRNDKARRLMRELTRTWAESDLKRLNNYTEWCECTDTPSERALANRVINQRNGTLAERIEALHAKEGPVFVAVGSLHMLEDGGLPTLLKARGFTVKQVF